METVKGAAASDGRPDRRKRAAVRARVKTPPARFWLVLQGDVLELVEADARPGLEVKPGERKRKILGAFATKEEGQERYDHWKPMARGVTGKGEAR